MWELEHLLATPSPRNRTLRNHVGQEPVGTRPELPSPGAASATDDAPSESLAEQNICTVQGSGAGTAQLPLGLGGSPPVLGCHLWPQGDHASPGPHSDPRNLEYVRGNLDRCFSF